MGELLRRGLRRVREPLAHQAGQSRARRWFQGKRSLDLILPGTGSDQHTLSQRLAVTCLHQPLDGLPLGKGQRMLLLSHLWAGWQLAREGCRCELSATSVHRCWAKVGAQEPLMSPMGQRARVPSQLRFCSQTASGTVHST